MASIDQKRRPQGRRCDVRPAPHARLEKVCAEMLIGAEAFSDAEMNDPILSGREDLRNPCSRIGPLSGTYYVRAVQALWSRLAYPGKQS